MAMDMDIRMDIQAKSVDMDMDGKFHIHGNPANRSVVEEWRRHAVRVVSGTGVTATHVLTGYAKLIMTMS